MRGLGLILRVALRNLSSSVINVIIGLILFTGTLLFVAGGSIITSMDQGMQRGIVGSVAGDAQVYGAASQDKPALFDTWYLPDLAPIADFGQARAALLKDPDVRGVVPMGVGVAQLAFGNTADEIFGRLRKAVEDRAPRAQVASLKAHAREIVRVIRADYGKLRAVAAKGAIDPRVLPDLERASSQAFWAGFDADPYGRLEFLENRIAPLIPDADQIFLNYLGTDLDEYRRSFPGLRIVEGTDVPPGRRGMLLPQKVYESSFKLKDAHRLDEIRDALAQGRRIKNDPELKDWVRENRAQTREILLQLDPLSARRVVAVLRKSLGSKDKDLPELLSEFFDTDDADFGARYKVFYGEIAPLLQLYRLKPGGTLTISAYTKSGYRREVNVKVYGTYAFKGLKDSDLAGTFALMDLVSFRDLYGYSSEEDRSETRSLEAQAGASNPPGAQAEADLFGGGAVFSTSKAAKIDDAALLAGLKGIAETDARRQNDTVYTDAQMDSGVALEGAVLFKQPARLGGDLARLRALCRRDKLGLKVLDWQKSAGNIGQFVLAANLILALATAIIFIVALVIINNAVVMATLQRVREIGTLRAIGAGKPFVLGMVLAETVLLGLMFGSAGALAGAGLIAFAGHVGIPASNSVMEFFFSGPRLYPSLSWGSLFGAFLAVLVVTVASALYPAVLATRVSPIEAIASED